VRVDATGKSLSYRVYSNTDLRRMLCDTGAQVLWFCDCDQAAVRAILD